MDVFTPPLFDFEDNFLQYLDEYGFVVIKNILTSIERVSYFSKFKNEFIKVSPNFDFFDTTTWTNNNLPIMLSKGMVVFNKLSHGDSMWMLRTNPKIQNIFKKIHNTNELITSFDGYSLFLKKEQKPGNWLHIDQNPKNDIYSIQGSYNYFKVNENDSGFVCVPKSHKTFKAEDFNPPIKHNKDWIVLRETDTYEGVAVKLLIPSNCFVLWNSKLIHANIGMSHSTTPSLNRLTAYITMFPKNLQTEENRQKRIEAYKNGDTCSHWPNKCQIKRYPYGFKANYEKKNFNKLEINPNIPENRFELI